MATYDRKDHLYKKAKTEGFRSRAAYKLIELDKKFSLFKSVNSVLDLGCAPGSWLEVVVKEAAKKPKKDNFKIVGVDLEYVEPIKGVELIQGDITDMETYELVLKHCDGKVDLVISDLSPHLSGIKFADALRAATLVESAYYCTTNCLRAGGDFVAKIFPGSDTDKLIVEMRKSFNKVKREVLSSTRKSSKEFYLVAKGFKG